MKEKEFQAAVIELAEIQGWRVYHTHDSRRSQPGYPDLTMVRGRHLIFAELKVLGGRPTKEQTAWLDDLGRVSGRIQEEFGFDGAVEARLWCPSDWPEIEQALKR